MNVDIQPKTIEGISWDRNEYDKICDMANSNVFYSIESGCSQVFIQPKSTQRKRMRHNVIFRRVKNV